MTVILSLLILSLGFSAVAADDSARQSLDSFEKVQSAVDKMDPTPKSGYCPTCEVLLPTQERAKCLEAICKDSSQKPFEIEAKARTAPDTDFEKDIAKKFRQDFELNWNNRLKNAKARVHRLEGKNSEWTDADLKQLGIAYTIFKMQKIEPEQIAGGGVKIISRYNSDETRQALPDASDAEIGFIQEVAEYILNDIMPEANAAIVFPPEVMLKEKYPNLTAEAAYQAEVSAAEAEFKKMVSDPAAKVRAKELGIPESQLQFSSDEFRNVGVPNSEQFRNLLAKKEIFKFVAQSSDEKSPLAKLASRIKPEWFEAPERKAKILDQAKRDLKFLENSNERNKAQALFESRCLAEIKYGLNTLPTPEENGKALEETKRLIAKLDQKVLSRFSKHSQEALRTELEKTQFVTPPSVDDFKKQQDSQINQSIQNRRRITSDPGSQITDVLENQPQKLYVERDMDNCTGEKYRMFSDASYGTAGAIRMGWGSVRHLDSGAAASAHELGHQLHRALFKVKMSLESRRIQAELGNCLLRMNTDRVGESVFAEDFADFIAAELMKGQSKSLFCQLVNQRELVENPDQLSMFRANTDDEHSSLFFRLIQTQRIQTGDLPAVCRKVVRDEQPKYLEKSICKLPEKNGAR